MSCGIDVFLFDGTRQPVAAGLEVLITLLDGNQRQVYRGFTRGAHVPFNLPFHNNFVDNYTVIASAKGYAQAGITPVKVSPGIRRRVDLMLLSHDAGYNFAAASWEQLRARRPRLAALLAAGAASDAAARTRFDDLRENRGACLACLLNVAAALDQIHLPAGQPLDYFRELIWDETMKQDRFFAYADRALLDQVRLAAEQGAFAPEVGSSVFHPGATASFKQVQFGEANIQLTFHEDDTRQIGGVECVKVEPDIDYYKDLGAHALLEVLPNSFTGSLTDPRQVYLLRWMSGRRAGVPEFDPLYTIV